MDFETQVRADIDRFLPFCQDVAAAAVQAAAQKRLVQGGKVPPPDQKVLIVGGAIVRIGVQAPADEALQDQGPQSLRRKAAVQGQKGGGPPGLQDHRVHGGMPGRKEQFLGRRALPGRLQNQGQDLLPIGQAEKARPVHLRGQLCLAPLKGGAQQSEKSTLGIGQFRFRHFLTFALHRPSLWSRSSSCFRTGKSARQQAKTNRHPGLAQSMVFPSRRTLTTFAFAQRRGNQPSRKQFPSPVVSKASGRRAVTRWSK